MVLKVRRVFPVVLQPAGTNKQNSSEETVRKKCDDTRKKCHRCWEPGHRWLERTALVIPAAKKSYSGCGDIIASLFICMQSKRDAVGEQEISKGGIDSCTVDRSAHLLRDMVYNHQRVTFKMVNNTSIDVEGSGSSTVSSSNKAGVITYPI